MHVDTLDLRGRRFTVVGGQGFVGKALVRTLHERGAHVWVPQRHEPLPWRTDLGHVIYCAGLTADYLARPADTVQAHACLLAQVLQQPGWDSLVYLSSTRLYDALAHGVATEDTTFCMDPANPRHLYDLSKALGESLCRVMGHGRVRVARLACVFDSPRDSDGFLPQLWRQLKAARQQGRQHIEVDSSVNFERDYVALADVVGALIAIALHGRHPVYNVASGQNVSNADLFAWLRERWNCHIVARQGAVAGPPARISISRLQQEFDWQPRNFWDIMADWSQEIPC